MSKVTVSKIPWADVTKTLRGYSAKHHQDVAGDKGRVFFSKPLQKWILLQKQGETAILRFSDDCPCSKMGVLY